MTSQFHLQWIVSEIDSGMLIKDFLKEAGVSKTALTDIKFNGGSIRVNNQDVTVRYRLIEGEKLTVIFPMEHPSEGLRGEDISIEIIYEDEHVLVVNKPAGINTIPSREHPSGSLANALVGYYDKINLKATTHIVTRLDRDTSGIVLIAKHRHIHHLLSKQQQNGFVRRTYEAFAGGNLEEDTGIIDEPIGRKTDSIIEREVRSDGQYACTYYSIIERNIAFTHLRLRLETGRTHQIRVHMSYLGHPLLGDDLYGGSTALIKRQALHCKEINFIHPINGQEMGFCVPLPEDMIELVKAEPLS
ncbi:RluA family pseudouridine synthase [Bacillus sp. MRMR6]|uniref:RluA family pseudouridine synthase n=1 Tax=Bacillus sp. MRMR6 TaxID=1928617 RepID=UPI000950EC47|nr:RluA family pseudouridine synthase [Bacillus sp. MRMR6]OLS41828.1 RNA pseudouridine synthase [Bacillus sp. MRMR6]